jgi:hypothetical protein
VSRGALIIVVAACAACSKNDPPPPPAAAPAEVERIGKLADEMRAIARAADAKRTKALLQAAMTMEPRPDLGPCPINVPIVGTENMQRLGQGEPRDADINWRSIRGDQMMVVNRDELVTAKSVRLKHVEGMLDSEQQRLNAKNVADTEKWLRYYGSLENASWEMVVIADKRVDPEIAEEGKFKSGFVIGRAFVYSHPSEKVVCAGRVVSHSSELLRHKPLTMQNGKDWNLVFDLENETFREAATKLVAVGPVVDDEAPRDAGVKREAGSRP